MKRLAVAIGLCSLALAQEVPTPALSTEPTPMLGDRIRIRLPEGAVVMTVPKRGEAIISAVGEMKEGDVLVIAGKGHEKGQIVGDEVLPFDDVEIAIAAIEQNEGF